MGWLVWAGMGARPELSSLTGVGVADDGPLRLAPQAQDLAEVVDQAGQDEPARVAVAANGLGGLQQVLWCKEHGRRKEKEREKKEKKGRGELRGQRPRHACRRR